MSDTDESKALESALRRLEGAADDLRDARRAGTEGDVETPLQTVSQVLVPQVRQLLEEARGE